MNKDLEKRLTQIEVHLEGISAHLEKSTTDTRLTLRNTDQIIVYLNKLRSYVETAMKALHKSFKMLTTGILNLREETSELAGTCVYDVV
jgi:hypothetical protein